MSIETPQTTDVVQDRVGHIEQRGIDAIPLSQRHGKPSEVFWLWLGTNLNIFYPITGVLLPVLGLSFWQSVLVIILGNLWGFLTTGLGSIQGPATGTRTFTISRAIYGYNGNSITAFFNWLQFIGFEGGGLALAVLAVQAIGQNVGSKSVGSWWFVVLFTLILIAIQIVVPVLGHATIMKVQRWLAYAFIVGFVIMLVFASFSHHLAVTSTKSGSLATLAICLAIIISAGGGGWITAANDYTAYLPPETNKKSIVLAATFGGFLAAVPLEIIGALVALSTPNATDPINGLASLLPSGLVIPYMLLLIATCLAVNTVDLYSSGLNVQAMGFHIRRVVATCIDMSICFPLILIAVLNNSFNTLYGEFLGLLIIFIAPWSGIFLMDCLIRRNRYNIPGLFTRHGIYRSWSPGALLALGLGMLASALCINSPLFVGPIAQWLGTADLSVFAGIGVGAACYWLFCHKRIKEQKAIPPRVP